MKILVIVKKGMRMMLEKMGEVLMIIYFFIIELLFIREVFINDYWLCKLIAGMISLWGLNEITSGLFS